MLTNVDLAQSPTTLAVWTVDFVVTMIFFFLISLIWQSRQNSITSSYELGF